MNKLVGIKPDANVYFYATEETIEYIGNKLLIGNSLSDVDIVLSRGEGLIGIITEIYKL